MNNEIKQLNIEDTLYPQALKEISDPPKTLHYRGNLDVLASIHKIAIVGTRRCSVHGRDATAKISKDLSDSGVVIVSGMARGVDTVAHEATLQNNSATIAILGSGIDDNSIYPRQNVGLAHQIILAGGLIASEYESGSPGLPHHFPKRNRIVAGLASGTLVVEAPFKSGSMITARLALEENRDVYAVPGPIFSRLSEGSNHLIKQGAKCVTNAKDILEEMGIETQVAQNKKTKSRQVLDTKEKILLGFIEESPQALHIDKILQHTKLGSIELSQILTSLMLKDLIKETEAGSYTAILT